MRKHLTLFSPLRNNVLCLLSAAFLRSFFLVFCVTLSTVPQPKQAKAYPYKTGTSVLFIGHSFFIPVARAYNEILMHPINKGRYPDHSYAEVFEGGAKGAPGALWASKETKGRIMATLSKGDTALLAMTAFGKRRGTNLYETSEAIDYQRWIDAALTHNPDTAFLIAIPWTRFGPKLDAADYDNRITQEAKRGLKLVQALQHANPGVPIHFIAHGKIAALSKQAFEAGRLSSVFAVCCGDESLFEDRFGHAGAALRKIAGAFFVTALTGEEDVLNAVTVSPLAQEEMRYIVNQAWKFHDDLDVLSD